MTGWVLCSFVFTSNVVHGTYYLRGNMQGRERHLGLGCTSKSSWFKNMGWSQVFFRSNLSLPPQSPKSEGDSQGKNKFWEKKRSWKNDNRKENWPREGLTCPVDPKQLKTKKYQVWREVDQKAEVLIKLVYKHLKPITSTTYRHCMKCLVVRCFSQAEVGGFFSKEIKWAVWREVVWH